MRMGLYNKPNEVGSYKVSNKLRAKIRESCVSGKVNKLKEIVTALQTFCPSFFYTKGQERPFVLPQSSPLLTTGAFLAQQVLLKVYRPQKMF